MSFQQGLSGLNAASTNLDVIGNNVANASTVGFKSASTQFSDVFASATGGGAGVQAGLGVIASGTSQNFGQGNINTTSNPLDLAINGAGFFVLSRNGTTVYSRDGEFQVNATGQIANAAGDLLQGYPVNAATGVVQTGSTGPITVSTADIAPQPTSTASIVANFNSSATSLNPANFNFTNPATYTNSTTLQIYDSLGNTHNLSLYFVKSTAGADQYDVRAQLDGNAVNAGATVGTIAFTSAGAINAGTTTFPSALSLTVGGGATTPQAVTLDFTGSTGYGSPFGVTTANQNGYGAGTLTGYSISSTGIFQASYSNGRTASLGQVVLANFSDPQGLQSVGKNAWVQTPATGTPLVGAPSTGTLGALQSGALEQSNVDLTSELVNMITAQRDYQASAESIKTQSALLQTLVQIAG